MTTIHRCIQNSKQRKSQLRNCRSGSVASFSFDSSSFVFLLLRRAMTAQYQFQRLQWNHKKAVWSSLTSNTVTTRKGFGNDESKKGKKTADVFRWRPPDPLHQCSADVGEMDPVQVKYYEAVQHTAPSPWEKIRVWDFPPSEMGICNYLFCPKLSSTPNYNESPFLSARKPRWVTKVKSSKLKLINISNRAMIQWDHERRSCHFDVCGKYLIIKFL